MSNLTKDIWIVVILMLFSALLSCNRVNIPQAEYSEQVARGRIPVFLQYDNGKLSVNDSIIEEFVGFRNYLIDMDRRGTNLRRYVLAIEADQNTPIHDLDSLLRVFNSEFFYRFFFLVNEIEDTTGFNFVYYTTSFPFETSIDMPDTINLKNLIQLKNSAIHFNGEEIETRDLDRVMGNIVFKKEPVSILADVDAKYKDLVLLFEKYHASRQHFKDLYSQLHFNKQYDWLLEDGLLKEEVDHKYRSRIGLLDESEYNEITFVYGKPIK